MSDWLSRVTSDMVAMEKLLSTPLSDNPVALTTQLTRAEAWYARANMILSEAKTYMSRAERDKLRREKGWTELDRKINLAADTADERELWAKAHGICDALKNRIMLGMNLRRSHISESSHAQT